MSFTKLSLRLTGSLPLLEEITRLLGVSPTFAGYRGSPSPQFKSAVLKEKHRLIADVWLLDLIEWEGVRADEQAVGEAASTLQRMAPILAAFDREGWHAQLYISSIRREEQGGIDIPAEIVIAAGAAKLELVISILIGIYEEDEEDVED